MAAQALYRKWRSQTFHELVGQEHVVRTLRNAIVEGRIAHAYLFTGPRGVGKTSMARLLAKAVNCTAEQVQRPCGICESCRAINEGRAVDIIEMDAASHTSVEDAREIIERVQFRPTSGRAKVYIIDEVHMLSTAAFNALLKTLEEPPDHAIFVLATTEVHKVPATILSRCQRFTFSRHTISEISSHLQHIASAEGLTLDADVAQAIARAATGSMRDALGILEQLGSFTSNHITLDQVHSLLGMTSAAEVNALIAALLSGDLTAALRAINGVADQGADLRQFTRDLVERLRTLMLLVAAGDRTLIDASEDELAQLEVWAEQASAASLVHWIKLFSSLDYHLRTSPYGHLPLELAVVEALVAPPPASQTAAPQPTIRTGQPAASVTQSPRSSRTVAHPPVARQPVPASDSEAAPPVTPVPPTPAQPPPAAREQQALPNKTSDQPTPPDKTSDQEQPPPPVAAGEAPVPNEQQPPSIDHPTNPVETDVQPQQTSADMVSEPPAIESYKAAAKAISEDLALFARVEEVWNLVVRDVRPRDRTLEAVLKSGVRPVNVEGTTIVLLAPYAFHQKRVEEARNRRIIEDVLSKHLGDRYSVRCTTELQTEKQDLSEQIREVRKDRRVHAAINVFDANIIGIEPIDQSE